MGIGFAALAQNLQISATANITGEWDVRITEILHANEYVVGTPTFDATSVTFEVELPYPGASGQFVINVENRGNIDAILKSITGVESANSIAPTEIQFSVEGGAPVGTPLNAGATFQPIVINVEWVANPDGESVIPDVKSKTATININYIQAT